MSLIVKICGLSTRETLDAALGAGADMVGFVFFPPSPRHLSLEMARELGKQAKGRALSRCRRRDVREHRRDAAAGRFAIARQGNHRAAARHQTKIRPAADEGA